ncbi:hypothetical protein Dip510_000668 [Elusimicrobium posterum]|uniref:hypothetical protein n=1 Tax=Elusimicrobium posterum TaxID=3116653 RepID=UPI003C765D1C
MKKLLCVITIAVFSFACSKKESVLTEEDRKELGNAILETIYTSQQFVCGEETTKEIITLVENHNPVLYPQGSNQLKKLTALAAQTSKDICNRSLPLIEQYNKNLVKALKDSKTEKELSNKNESLGTNYRNTQLHLIQAHTAALGSAITNTYDTQYQDLKSISDLCKTKKMTSCPTNQMNKEITPLYDNAFKELYPIVLDIMLEDTGDGEKRNKIFAEKTKNVSAKIQNISKKSKAKYTQLISK